MNQEIKINAHHFILDPSGAIFWKEMEMLLIADVHLGKVTHFRKHGAAIPVDAAYQNLEKITAVTNHFEPKTICFLGDLFHSKINEEWEDFTKWVEYTSANVILISGNHDIIPVYLYEDLGIKVFDDLILEDFLLTHHPTEHEDYFNFSGHIHPGVILRGVGRQYLRLPCFFKSLNSLILPAFGNFTGKHILSPTENDEVYAIVEGEVICVSK